MGSPVGRYFLLALLTMSWLGASNDCRAERIPEVHGTSLSNAAVNLPEALKGKVGVLVLGFSRDSREADSAWGKRLAADYRESPTVVYYEMPENEAAWKAVTHYGRPDDPYLLVVDGEGNVVWQTQGMATDAGYADLKQHVEALRAQLGIPPAR
jgi:hypothetical protein